MQKTNEAVGEVVVELAVWNPRYAAFAKSNGRTPEEQRADDRKHFPLAGNVPFILWMAEKRVAFEKAGGAKAGVGLSDAQSRAFAAFIGAAS